MPWYRFYPIDGSGHIAGVRDLACDCEDEMRQAATAMLRSEQADMRGIEAWEGAHKAYTVERPPICH